MNVSYEWLRSLVPFDESAVELRDLITARVAVVDELVALRADLAPIVVARVVEASPHPDSDHLSVTKVDAGSGTLLDVVCGAPNVRAGKLYPFAPTGTLMPGGLRIEKRKIRGALSNGMLCSSRELGLGTDHEGIMELAGDVTPGTPFLRAFPVGDARLVVDVMPNRPDLLSHLGIGREVAAATGRALELPDIGGGEEPVPAPKRFRRAGNAGGVAVHLEEPTLAQRFMGVVIRDVTIGPSPDWLVERLASVGSRSINNVVDASNYVLHELGQPTHAFDLSKVEGGSIVVRRAAAGERITTLDGVDRALDTETIVIADAIRPQAVAGIMGGQGSAVTDATTDIFLEVANFDPRRIRAARRRLGLSTDASYRFERGVDVALAPRALDRAARLIVTLAGGRVDGAPVDIYAGETAQPRLTLRVQRLTRLLGDAISAEGAALLLRGVGFTADVEPSGDALRVDVPSWRRDVVHEADLVEEVARLRGYDSFPDEIRPFRAGNSPDDPAWIVARRVRDALVGLGLFEARPLPFVRGAETGFVGVANPIAENEACLRREILDTLARRAEYNLARMAGDVRLFEIGSVFLPTESPMPAEEVHVGALLMGQRRPPHFTEPTPPPFDAWDAKGLAEQLVRVVFPGGAAEFRPATDGALWEIRLDGVRVGEVREATLDAPVWASPAFGVELSLGPVPSADVAPRGENAYANARPAPRAPYQRYRPLPTTPAAEIDLALLVPDGVTAAEVDGVIRAAAGELLEALTLFDEFRGEHLPSGYRSLAWRLTFRHPERTLRDKEIEGRRARILGALDSELNVRQRTS